MRNIPNFRSVVLGVLVAGLLSLVAVVQAAVPWVLNYQGRLTDSGNKAVTGTYTMKFRLYDASTGGTKLWEESQSVTLAESDNGVFNVILGTTTVLTSVDFNSPMWLSVQVADDSEMTPRQRLTSSAYTMNADQVDGLDSSKFLRTDIDTSTSGKLTITRAGAALVITPSSAPDANTKMLDVQNTSGTSKFSVDYEGDVTVAGDLAVTGTISGSTSTTGTTSASWTTGSATNATSTDLSLLLGQSSGQESLVFDGDGTDNFLLSDDLQLSAQGALLLADSDSSNYVALKGPATVSSNVTWIMPSADGSANQLLATDGSGTLSWVTASSLSGVGDVTAVGDITSGAAFTATSGADGTTLYFEGSSSDGNEIALTSANPGSDLTVTIPATAGTLITTGDSGTVTSTMILDDTIAAGDIATSAVTTTEILDDTVAAADIATGGVATAEILNGTIAAADIGSGVITTTEIALDTIAAVDIAAGAVDASELASTAVTAASYGSSTAVPTFTVDADGRLTAASNTTISLSGSNITDDSLDFAQFDDTLDLDANLTLNQTTYTASQSFTGTTTTGLTYTATNLTSGTALDVNATNTHTADAAIQQVRFDLVNAQATLANADVAGLNVNFTNNPSVAGNTEVAMRIQHPVTANTTDNAVSALLLLENVDTSVSGATVVTDALRVQATTNTYVTDGLDVSDAEIDNAINVGANTITGTTPAIDFTNFDVSTTGGVTTGANGQDGQVVVYSEQGATDYSITINPHATMTQNVTYTLPADDGTSNQVLTTDGSGALSWATASGISGVGDVTDVGNCSGSACFTGTSGTTLTSTTSEILDLGTDATLIFQRNTAGDVTFMGKDNSDPANTIYDTAGAGAITIGSADVTSVTVTTDGTGTAELALPAGSIDSTEILDDTVAAADIATGGVATAEILNGTIAAADIGSGVITTTEIALDTIAAVDIATDGVGAAEIAADALLYNEVGDAGAAGSISFDSGETGTYAFTISANTSQAGSYNLDLTNGINTTGTLTQSALDIDLTNADHSGGTTNLYGLDLQVTDNDNAATSNVYALNVGSGFDRAMSANSRVVIAAGANATQALLVSGTITNTTSQDAIAGSMENTSSTVGQVHGSPTGVYGEGKISNTTAGLLGTPIYAYGVYGAGIGNVGDLDGGPTVDMLEVDAIVGKVTNSGAGKLSNGYTFRALAPANSGGGSITNTYGVHIADQGLSGTTTTYGLYIANQTGSTTNHAIYQTGTTGTNVLNAKTAIGSTTAPTYELDVTGNARVSKQLIGSGGTAPTVSSCGTGPSISGTDFAGKVTVGTGSTISCTVTFASAYTTAPACSVLADSTTARFYGSTSTTALTITSSASMASAVLMYICIGG